MCGRFTFHATPEILAEHFALADVPAIEPRYNIVPTQSVPVVRAKQDGQWYLELLRWGLVPFWARDRSIGNRLINARAETVAEKTAFKHAFKRRRCLVLASGFYEWQTGPAAKIPVYITDPSGRPYAFAALWERWRDQGQALETCTIITVPANGALAKVHHRMPALLDQAGQNLWLNAGAAATVCQQLLVPASDRITKHWPVSRCVNDPGHEGAGLIRPLAEA